MFAQGKQSTSCEALHSGNLDSGPCHYNLGYHKTIDTAFMTVTMFRRHVLERDGKFFGAKVSPEKADAVQVNDLMARSLRWIAVAAVVAAVALFVMIPLYLSQLAQMGEIGVASLEPYSGPMFLLRLALVGLGAGLLAVFIFAYAKPDRNPKPLAVIVTLAFVLVLAGELLGRAEFYEAMVRIGM